MLTISDNLKLAD